MWALVGVWAWTEAEECGRARAAPCSCTAWLGYGCICVGILFNVVHRSLMYDAPVKLQAAGQGDASALWAIGTLEENYGWA